MAERIIIERLEFYGHCGVTNEERQKAQLLAVDLELDATLKSAVLSDRLNETIDYAIMEKADRVAVIPLDAGWSDVGSWTALWDIMERDASENAVHGEHISVDTRNSLIYTNKRLVATIGLENMIVIDTEDALLICPQDRAQDVKKIVDELKRRQAHRYL